MHDAELDVAGAARGEHLIIGSVGTAQRKRQA